MKKILIIFILLVSGSLFVACQSNTAPEIKGVKDQTIGINSTFNSLAGVTASDKEDGDLTSSIEVTGTVNTAVVGDYTVKYSVKDTKGLEATATATIEVSNLPTISGATAVTISFAEVDEFDALAGVSALDADGVDISSSITVSGSVGYVLGQHSLVYTVVDAAGLSKSVTRVVTVVADYANGVYNFKFASPDVRNTLFAAAEAYLLSGMYGGIPIYVAQSMSLLADRISLPVDAYIPSYGWGTTLADITKDDSQIKMTNGLPGNANEYTYRSWVTQDFGTLNFWTYDDSASATYLDMISGGFYRATLNDNRNGWEWATDLAAGDPVPFGASHKVVNGKDTSKSWRIPLKNGLQWSFNSAINTTGFDLVIDSDDYIWTYREALTLGLFRAISGGGDFVKEVAGAQAYYALAGTLVEKYKAGTLTAEEQETLDAAWLNVGLKKGPDNSIEITFNSAKSSFDVKYNSGWPAMNQDLWIKYGPYGTVDPNTYGNDETHIASSGLYIFSYFENDKISRFVKNPNCPYASETKWTGEEIVVLESAEVAFNEFLGDKLDSVGIPNARIEEFITDPRLLQSPDATTWRYNINGLKTIEAAHEVFPDTEFVPEPILGYTNFRQALYWSLNRIDLQENWVPTRGEAIGYFSGAYYVDPESGVPYRNSPQAQALAELYGSDSRGYNLDAALWYFHEALLEANAEGYYNGGTAESPVVITINLRVMQLTTSEAIRKTADWTKESWEKLIDPDLHVQVEIVVIDTAFPDIYYDYQMVGNYDIAIGGISGSSLDAASFLDVFCSDNRGKFTINWGFDTSIPNITVEYEYDFGNGVEKRAEVWSYNALITALSGKAIVVDGVEQAPILVEGVYNQTEIYEALEDFVPFIYDLEFADGDYEVIKGARGIFITFDSSTTLEDLETLLAGAGYSVVTYDDGTWCAEFASSKYTKYILTNLLEEADELTLVSEVFDYFGETVPTDADGNELVVIYIY